MSVEPHGLDTIAQSEVVRNYFEQELSKLELAERQIETQSLEELRGSLDRVNEAVLNPDSFGKIRVKLSADGQISIVTSGSRYHQKVGALPLLLERKKQILDRMRLLSQDQTVGNLRDALKLIEDQNVREKLEEQLKALENESSSLQEETKSLQEQQEKVSRQEDIDFAKQRLELFERKSKVWRFFLERESMATIVGSFLLILLTVCLIVAMFIGKEVSEVITNAFLLILGYFFGQTVARRKSGDYPQA
jgi:hypothetical protein